MSTKLLVTFEEDNNDSDNEIVFKDDNGELYCAQFTNDKGGILNVVEYNFLESVDPLLDLLRKCKMSYA